MAIILDCSIAAASIRTEIAEAVSKSVAQGNRPPGLVAILVGEDGASQTYVGAKKTACDEVGFAGDVRRFAADITETELLAEIEKINQDETIDGLIVQLPLPKHISEEKVTQAILPAKDVDGFHDINMGKLAKGDESGVKPATPYGITLLMKHYGIDASGKHVVVVGRSNIVGRPMSMLLSAAAPYGNATVTLCHSRTKDLGEVCRRADILVAAVGRPEMITGEWVKPGATVIDVGINRIERDGKVKLVGDVHFESAARKAGAITPVPGGVGPMTIACLLANTLTACCRAHNLPEPKGLTA